MDPPSIIKKPFKYSPSHSSPHPLHYIRSSHNKPLHIDHDDTEISIFDAHKYFGETNDTTTTHQQNKPDTLPRLSSFHATPTASSEASWNSQTGLLVNPPGSIINLSLSSRNHLFNKNSSSSSSAGNNNKNNNNNKWTLGRKCCCTGKKSVRVKEPTTPLPPTNDCKSNMKIKTLSNRYISQSTTTDDNVNPSSPDPPRQQRISATGGFSFPILKNPARAAVRPPGPGFKGMMITKSIVSQLDEDARRDSLEVYQPTPMDNCINNITARHRYFNPGSPIGRVETTDDDLGSDASSDLFELESFSTQTSLYPMYRRRSLDEQPPTPSVAATECYAPSEVSIDWSVTTAEGYDRASVSNFSVSASESGGAAFFRQRMKEEGGGEIGKRKGNGGGGGGGGLLLMSCRHGKTVSVGPQPVKCAPAEGGGGMHVGGRPPRASKTTALGNDHSARMSLAFAA